MKESELSMSHTRGPEGNTRRKAGAEVMQQKEKGHTFD